MSLSAVSLENFGIRWSYLTHTNQLYTSSEAFWKSETYWKQTGLYLHSSMSEIARLEATFSESLSSNSSWTDQAKHKVLNFGQAIKNWALFGEIQTLKILKEKEDQIKIFLWDDHQVDITIWPGYKIYKSEPWFQGRLVTWAMQAHVR